jgi:hypothetical protein
VAALKSAGLIPNFSTVASWNAPTPADRSGTYQPCDVTHLGGMAPYQPSGGPAPYIGPFTEDQAWYIATGSSVALSNMMVWLDVSGTMPWHYRDETTHAPINVDTYSGIILGGGGTPPMHTVGDATGITVDTAHLPDFGYLPYLLTGDPYALECVQFTSGYCRIAYKPGNGYSLGFATRAWAWALRSLVDAVDATPSVTPSWFLPKSYYTNYMAGERDWTTTNFVSGASGPLSGPFACISNAPDQSPETGPIPAGCGFASFMEDYANLVIALIVQRGHTDWTSILNWKIQNAFARTNGTSGWNRSFPGPQWVQCRNTTSDPFDTTWTQLYAHYGGLPGQDNTNMLPGQDPTAAQVTHATLSLGATLGVTGAAALRDWMRPQMTAVVPTTTNLMQWQFSVA